MNTTKILSISYYIVVSLIVLNCSSKTGKTPDKIEKPNIIYVMLDDAGYGDFGAFGSTDVLTPSWKKKAFFYS